VPRDVAEKAREGAARPHQVPDGSLLGDWKAGERIAQTGVGMQYSDDPKNPTGGNCYACHQLAKAELAYGTIGPPLYNFGKLRGFTPEMQRYAYGKVYNSDAFAACSNMPRFGHQKDPHRAADQGRGRAADGSGIAGQQMTCLRAIGADRSTCDGRLSVLRRRCHRSPSAPSPRKRR
jgi:sulfur oxidation c-type cytochrome SoxX